MITSDKQHIAAQQQLAMLKESLVATIKTNVPDEIRNVSKAQIQELIDQIQSDISEYESLKTLNLKDLEIHSIHDLMVTPIRYRIVSHMSVDAFSHKVGISARQIHRYEAANYSNANTSTLTKILEKLDISLDGRVSL
jgi:hypothetical protein